LGPAGRADELSANLQSALDSRSVIDQALGIVMDAQHCNAARIVASTSSGAGPQV
jgi:hypothetical protein